MMAYTTDDLRISGMKEVVAPEVLLGEQPVTDKGSETVVDARDAIHKVLHDEDDRLVVIVGPCSIHDTKAALEYAALLEKKRQELGDRLIIIMRVYFEKPRTTVGWKGLINDPNLNDSFNINDGLRTARKLLSDLAEQGMPAATEYLDLITPQYVADLVSWGAIGARTTESQGHRELASGLSCPVGFKNGTNGDVQVAADAIGAACRPHHFLSVTKQGHSAIFQTTGNKDCHVILRGGQHPNYDAASVDDASTILEGAGLKPRIMIDTSHANSRKIPERQIDVGHNIAEQVAKGEQRIFGVMIEGHLVAGRQNVVDGKELTYGQSITDGCLGWDDTSALLDTLAEAVASRRNAGK